MTVVDLLAGLLIAVGVVGVLVPLLPGVVLVAGAILGWAALTGGTTAWVTAGLAGAVLVVGEVVTYAVPGRRLAAAGVPVTTQLAGALAGVVGFVVVPVVGLLLGFPLGIYLAELRRVGPQAAWPSTRAALGALGLSILLELATALVAALVWTGGVVAT